MGFSVRSLVSSIASSAILALVVAPAPASAQGSGRGTTAPTSTAPPPGGGAPAAGAAATGGAAGPAGGDKAAPAADAPKSSGNVGGVSFNDKPTPRRAPVARGPARRGGPLETFPGFEQLPDGSTRFFVHLNQNVPVEERRATGSVTYVMKGAHLRVNNDANALVTVHFNTPVFRARLSPQGNDLLFILELRSAVTPTFKMTSNADKTSTLQIDFAKGDFITGDGNETIPRDAANVKEPRRRRVKGGRDQPVSPSNGDDANGPTP